MTIDVIKIKDFKQIQYKKTKHFRRNERQVKLIVEINKA